jgi:hypothetical protein
MLGSIFLDRPKEGVFVFAPPTVPVLGGGRSLQNFANSDAL